jgi:GntR family transcriptional regulator
MSEFLIQTNSDVPIYRQLVDQVHRLAASGRLTAGERLPSVRQLAEELAINPMTVSKAYSLLEQEGFLERQRGIGMVLTGDSQSRHDLIRPALVELVRQARQLGLAEAELLDSMKNAWNEEASDD